MAKITVNHVDLEYETYGSSEAEPLLMVMGLSNQLIDWPDALISALSEQFYVVIFDNRDSGLSSKMEPNAEYSLYDLAADTLGLADALDLETFHLAGFSMGGMISQIIAIEQPNRVLSLTSLMSTDGVQHFKSKAVASDAIGQSGVIIESVSDRYECWFDLNKHYRGTGLYSNDHELKEGVIKALDRSYCPDGILRQRKAMEGTPDRDITKIQCPTLIIHGEDDPCILLDHAMSAHKKIQGSTLRIIEGLGHEFPSELTPKLIDLMMSFLKQS
jgi:pimeloyl-ACP methyl ester carboxylesterase